MEKENRVHKLISVVLDWIARNPDEYAVCKKQDQNHPECLLK